MGNFTYNILHYYLMEMIIIKEEKLFCKICYKPHLKRDFYKNLLENNIYVCKDCIYNEFKNLYSKYESEESALLLICNKYNIKYDYEEYLRIKRSTTRIPFKVYVTYMKTLGIKYNTMDRYYSKSYIKKFNDYLRINNIIIQDIFKFDYEIVFNEINCIGTHFDVLEFIVQYYDYKYPGYKFKILSSEYYNKKRNLIFELKYFIEKEKNITLDDIPYILTLKYLKDKNTVLYNVMLNGNIYNNLYEWINDCYPNKFIESDFNRKSISFFDSNIEEKVHTELLKLFENVLYNKRGILNIRLGDAIPDWLIFTTRGTIISEYFGLYEENSKTHMQKHYKERTFEKLKEYKTFKNYYFLFLYKEDIKDDFSGLKLKVENLKQEMGLT